MKKLFCLFGIALCLLISNQALAVGNFTFGGGATGNIFVVDASPELDPGVGGHLYFDYRWSPQFSTQIGVVVTTEDGTGISNGDNGIEFLGIPTFDLKFYILKSDSRWDPYGLIGTGIYAVSEGTTSDGTTAVGVGANLGLGIDYYLTEELSVGGSAIYRSIALIDSTSGSNNGTAIFPFSLQAGIAWHW